MGGARGRTARAEGVFGKKNVGEGGASYRPLPSSDCSMNHHPKRYRAAPGLRQMERGLYPRVMG